MEKLNEFHHGKFFQFIKEHYSDILTMSAGIVSTVLKISTDTVASEIFNCMTNTNSILYDMHKEQESSIKVICKFIKEISLNDDLVIVIKNFSYCDEYSINSILLFL